MMSKVIYSTPWSGLEWQMEKGWGDNYQTDKQQADTPNSQVNDFDDLEDCTDRRLKPFFDDMITTRNHLLTCLQYGNWWCTQTGILGDLRDGQQDQSMHERDVDKNTFQDNSHWDKHTQKTETDLLTWQIMSHCHYHPVKVQNVM